MDASLMSEGLRIEHLTGRVPGPFDLRVAPGECACIMGPSGAGKSSLLRMIADLEPSTGRVSLDGASREGMRAPAWRRQVIYVGSDAGWWADRVANHFVDATRVRTLLPLLALDPALLDAQPTRLSTGERQRLSLIRAIERDPRFLLLDEPTSSLDAESTARVESLLRDVRARGIGLVVVSHSREQALRLDATHYRLGATGVTRTESP